MQECRRDGNEGFSTTDDMVVRFKSRDRVRVVVHGLAQWLCVHTFTSVTPSLLHRQKKPARPCHESSQPERVTNRVLQVLQVDSLGLWKKKSERKYKLYRKQKDSYTTSVVTFFTNQSYLRDSLPCSVSADIRCSSSNALQVNSIPSESPVQPAPKIMGSVVETMSTGGAAALRTLMTIREARIAYMMR